MKTTTIASSLLAATIAASAATAFAAERATPAEAKAMLQKAEAHYKKVGRKMALADFSIFNTASLPVETIFVFTARMPFTS